MRLDRTRRALLAGLGSMAFTHAVSGGAVLAEMKSALEGQVVLTIAGDIAHANRGAFDAVRDGFFKYHEIEFDKAFAFDRAMLEEFPLKEIRCQPPNYVSSVTFRGPLLRDVLKVLGAESASIKTRALDGFAVDLTSQQLAAQDWILVTQADGRPLGIGAKGPVWLMHTPSSEKVTDEEEQSWPWAVFYIEVSK